MSGRQGRTSHILSRRIENSIFTHIQFANAPRQQGHIFFAFFFIFFCHLLFSGKVELLLKFPKYWQSFGQSRIVLEHTILTLNYWLHEVSKKFVPFPLIKILCDRNPLVHEQCSCFKKRLKEVYFSRMDENLESQTKLCGGLCKKYI